MKKALLVFAASILLLIPQASFAQAKLTAVHGISGGVLGLDPALPVDVWVNGAPFLTDFRFTDIVGPVELPAGEYDIQVFLAGSDPDVEAPVLELSAALVDGLDVALVAHLTPGGGIALTPFFNNTAAPVENPISARLLERDVRLTVRHTADFPRVAINRLVDAFEPTLANGETLSLDLSPGEYGFWLSRAGSLRPLSFDPVTVDLAADTSYYVFAVGSWVDGSFQLLLSTDSLP